MKCSNRGSFNARGGKDGGALDEAFDRACLAVQEIQPNSVIDARKSVPFPGVGPLGLQQQKVKKRLKTGEPENGCGVEP